MKRRVNGTMYNTETDRIVHTWDNNDKFDYREELLYRTPTGSYCLVKFTNLSNSEAQTWLESHEGPANVIKELFGIERK